MVRVLCLKGPAALSDRTGKAFQLAHQEAHRLSHCTVGPDHLLLGLAKEGFSHAASILGKYGFGLSWLRQQVEFRHPPKSRDVPLPAALPYSEELMEFLDDAVPATCGGCGEIITGDDASGDAALRVPCPKCGSTARNFSLFAQPGEFLVVGGVATLTVTRCPSVLLQTAQRFTDGGDYGVAIIVAHMACEVAAERALGDAFASRGVPDLEQPVEALMSGYNLANPRNRDLYNALAGVAGEGQILVVPRELKGVV
jgi:hypothetical protein